MNHIIIKTPKINLGISTSIDDLPSIDVKTTLEKIEDRLYTDKGSLVLKQTPRYNGDMGMNYSYINFKWDTLIPLKYRECTRMKIDAAKIAFNDEERNLFNVALHDIWSIFDDLAEDVGIESATATFRIDYPKKVVVKSLVLQQQENEEEESEHTVTKVCQNVRVSITRDEFGDYVDISFTGGSVSLNRVDATSEDNLLRFGVIEITPVE